MWDLSITFVFPLRLSRESSLPSRCGQNSSSVDITLGTAMGSTLGLGTTREPKCGGRLLLTGPLPPAQLSVDFPLSHGVGVTVTQPPWSNLCKPCLTIMCAFLRCWHATAGRETESFLVVLFLRYEHILLEPDPVPAYALKLLVAMTEHNPAFTRY